MLFSARGTVLYAKSSMGDGPISIETQPVQPGLKNLLNINKTQSSA
jgi:hypothetical protein